MKQVCLCGGVWRRNLEGTINSARIPISKTQKPNHINPGLTSDLCQSQQGNRNRNEKMFCE